MATDSPLSLGRFDACFWVRVSVYHPLYISILYPESPTNSLDLFALIGGFGPAWLSYRCPRRHCPIRPACEHADRGPVPPLWLAAALSVSDFVIVLGGFPLGFGAAEAGPTLVLP
jgi:hypothetical protein